jgi:predicted GNAT superfamily acetyltransferase
VARGQTDPGLVEGRIEVRSLARHEEFAQAVDLQRVIWQFDELELLPVRLFVVASKVGGQILGAYDHGRMIGFCLALPGVGAHKHLYLHSHMLGVLEEYRNSGIGRMLKLAQRDDALGRGLDLIEWTFDPLEIKNAYFNLERLGAIVRRFVLNQYGATTSPLHAGLPTDRCIAEWWIRSPHVEAALKGEPRNPNVIARIEVPSDIEALKHTDPARARQIQKKVSDEFVEHLSKGLAAVGFDRTPRSGIYKLGRWESQ